MYTSRALWSVGFQNLGGIHPYVTSANEYSTNEYLRKFIPLSNAIRSVKVKIFILLFMFLSLGDNLLGQEEENYNNSILDSSLQKEIDLKSNNSFLIDTYEGKLLNTIFDKSRGGFNFVGKKIGFITGSNGRKLSKKEDYFSMLTKHLNDNLFPCDNGELYIFDARQKEESGGYDAAIVYWNKALKYPVGKVVQRLKKSK